MARKKAEPKQELSLPPDPDIDDQPVSLTSDSEPEDVLGDFPLREGHYFHTYATSNRSHHGVGGADVNAIMALQRVVGVTQTGQFDTDTAAAVSSWKQAHGLDRSPVVDGATWQEMRHG